MIWLTRVLALTLAILMTGCHGTLESASVWRQSLERLLG